MSESGLNGLSVWDTARRYCPILRRPGVHAVKSPRPIFVKTAVPEGMLAAYELGGAWEGWKSLLPKGDVSWVRPPFDETAIVCPSDAGFLYVQVMRQDYRRMFVRSGVPEAIQQIMQGAQWVVSVDVFTRGVGYPIVLATGSQIVAATERGAELLLTSEASAILADERAMQFECSRQRILGEHSDSYKQDLYSSEKIHQLGDLACGVAVSTFGLMCCKNVEVVQRRQPRQMRRLAERNGELPLASWHELKLVARNTERHKGTVETQYSNALHWVRGHFKDYRSSGLFGRARGVYWWSPHLAGTADRVVFKDYDVSALASHAMGGVK